MHVSRNLLNHHRLLLIYLFPDYIALTIDKVPERGHITPELKILDVTDYREIHYQVYRIIYRVKDNEVFIYAVLHGRRDIQTLLRERLLR